MTGLSPIGIKSRGFISIHALLILSMIISICSVITAGHVTYYRFKKDLPAIRKMNRAEILIVNRIKDSYRGYREKDESFVIDDIRVTVKYRDLTAEIVIRCGEFERKRELVFDDIGDFVEKYR